MEEKNKESKIKNYIENNLAEELKYFQRKYSFDIKLIPDNNFIIPEYKINLLNKSKKIINSFENIIEINNDIKIKKNLLKEKKETKKEAAKNKVKTKKKKTKKKVRTLWVRRKKTKLNLQKEN